MKRCLWLTFLVLIPLLWFRNGLLIAGGDMSIFLNPSIYWHRLFLWTNYFNGGQVASNISIGFPFILFFKLVDLIGLPSVIAQKLWFIFSYAWAIFSISFLYLTAVVNTVSLGFLFAAIFYLFNIYTLLISPFTFQYWLLYATMPLTLALFIKGLNVSGKKKIKYLVLTALSSLFYSGTNAALFLSSFIVLIAYLLFFIFTHAPVPHQNKVRCGTVRGFAPRRGPECKGATAVRPWGSTNKVSRPYDTTALIFALKVFILIIIVNLWSLYPLFATLFYYSSSNLTNPATVSFANATHIYQATRLMGQWAWPQHHLFQYYNNNLFMGLSYIIPLIVVGCLIFNSIKLDTIFFLLLACLGIFLSKGINAPLGFIYRYILKLTGFGAFREPFSKFTFITTLSYTMLLGVFVDNLTAKLTRFKKVVFLCLLSTTILMSAWPIFTPNYISPLNDINERRRSFHIKIPDYWKDSTDWLFSQKGDFSVLELPKDNGYGMPFNWEFGYDGINPALFLFNKSTWGNSLLVNDSGMLVNLVYDGLYNKVTDRLALMLGLMNIKFLHLRGDLEWKAIEAMPPQDIEEKLAYQKDIRLAQKIGNQYFYENTKALPLIYAVDYLKVLDGMPQDHGAFRFIEDIADKRFPAVFFRAQNKSPDFLKKGYQGNSMPEIRYKKINPCRYKVDVYCKEPFYLVFSQSFHHAWKAYVKGRAVKEHFVINGYANGYFIEKTGKFSMELEFFPQRFENLCLAISASVVFFSLVYLAIISRQARHGKIS